MKKRWKALSLALSLTLVTGLVVGCGKSASETTTKENDSNNTGTISKVDMSKWQYDSDNDVYYQVGISYCANPADTNYETLGIFVPGKYMNAEKNEDGTYTCTVNTSEKVGNYTAENAPIVFPVNTPGYSAQNPPTGYDSSSSSYTAAGMIYVAAGCRGRNQGAPAGVTDLKAAIRYIRYNKDELPGNTDSIFSFGHSGGGAQSSLLGATGDSELYDAYLDAIGAVDESDAIAGSMCWCPITNLDVADAAYEWNLGSSRTDLDDDTKKISDSLATAFAEYINELGLKDGDGKVLTLEASEEGIYQAGTYYNYVKETIENSLNTFLKETEFPYDASSSGKQNAGMQMSGGNGGPGGDGERPSFKDGEKPSFKDGEGPSGNQGNTSDGEQTTDGVNRMMNAGSSLTGTYDTVEDYIKALNELGDGDWIQYDGDSNTATITSVAAFVKACKSASKTVSAFDALDKSQAENTVFGYGDGQGAHFDSILADIVKGTDYETSFTEDLAKTDALGNTVDYRVNMYNPMYYLSDYYEGYQKSTVAKYWRIRTGINQGDTALSTEIDLALALQNYGVDVDFATVWGQGHTEAEISGDATTNFINWINECLQ